MMPSRVLKRNAITERQRLTIRELNRQHPEWRQIDLLKACERELDRRFSQSTISDTLGRKFDYLDQHQFKNDRDQGKKRERTPRWPDLEAALFDWQQSGQTAGIPINGDMIKKAAEYLWQKLPCYNNVPMPSWSTGWLHAFKTRHHIKEYKMSGEAKSADLSGGEQRMAEIRDIVQQYETRDIYNADETALYWKMIPERTLATAPVQGSKKDKSRITIFPTVNADGSHRLDSWVLGKSAVPRCFGRSNNRIAALPIVYRSNQKAWMTSAVFREYLRWFDRQMTNRNVLLLVDGFSAHLCGLQLVKAEGGLTNTRVEILPANCTAFFQPLDQGIIENFKCQYRHLWLDFMAECHLRSQDASTNVTLLHAVQWVTRALRMIKNDTISNCFRKATVFGIVYGPEKKPTGWDEELHQRRQMQQIVDDLAQAGAIRSAMDISNFILPTDEQLETNYVSSQIPGSPSAAEEYMSAVLDDVVHAYTTQDEEVDEVAVDAPPDVTLAAALEHYAGLIVWVQREQSSNLEFLATLEKQHRSLLMRRKCEITEGKKQTTLDRYLGAN